MIVPNNPKMVAEAAEILCERSICSVQFNISIPKSDAVSAELASVSIDVVSLSDSAVNCTTGIQTTLVESSPKFIPTIRSGSHTDIGPRKSNEDEHIRIDDLSNELGILCPFYPLRSSFYAVFDGHGGSEAASYLKDNAMKLFFIDSDLPQTSYVDDPFLEKLKNYHSKAFLLADRALADECSVSDYCGTTALTALILGRYLLITNAGDCRAVLCRKGVAIQLSQDHRPVYPEEKIRVEALGGFIVDGYLNGELSVSRALGDRYMKPESESPLTAKPDIWQTVLTKDDEFLIIGCDGIWDVMSNQEAVTFVRRHLRLYDDPQICAKALVNQALCRKTSDNLTVIIVCFTSGRRESESVTCRQRPRFKCGRLTEEARDRI